jgi:hypothetical protein
MLRFALLVLLAQLPVTAGSVDITNESFALFGHGDSLTIEAGVWNYGMHNPGISPYPTGIGFSLVATNPGVPAAALPESTAQYYPGYLFDGSIRSLDGSVTAPLEDPVAELLGLGPGKLVLVPGDFYAGGASDQPVGVISGSANLTLENAQALFGSSFMAEIVLRNLGPDVLLGLGDGYTIRNSVTVPGVTGMGDASVGGIPGSAFIETPELGTGVLAAIGAAALILFRRAIPGMRAAPERTPAHSRA